MESIKCSGCDNEIDLRDSEQDIYYTSDSTQNFEIKVVTQLDIQFDYCCAKCAKKEMGIWMNERF